MGKSPIKPSLALLQIHEDTIVDFDVVVDTTRKPTVTVPDQYSYHYVDKKNKERRNNCAFKHKRQESVGTTKVLYCLDKQERCKPIRTEVKR